MAAFEVCYEKAVCFEIKKFVDEMEALRLLQNQGLKPFLSLTPDFLLTAPIVEFFTNLEVDEKTESIYTTFSFNDSETQVRQTVDVRKLAWETFQIPHQGKSLDEIPTATVQDLLDKAIYHPSKAKLLKVVTLGGHYKVRVHIIYQWFIGLLGSKDQVSGEQKKMLAMIVSDDRWDWKSVFIKCLNEDKAKAISKSKKFRTGLKVSAMILTATKERNVTWSSKKPIPGNAIFLKKSKAAPKKKVAVKKNSASSFEAYLMPDPLQHQLQNRKKMTIDQVLHHLLLLLPIPPLTINGLKFMLIIHPL